MLKDCSGRIIDYLRISVTQRCNLACIYCVPLGGSTCSSKEELLSLGSLSLLAECAVELGVRKIRITGGEPLVREGLFGFVERIAQLRGLSDLSLTTNGMLLKALAWDLKKSGMQRINVSVDSLNREKFRWITKGGDLRRVLAGIDEALRVGLVPVKVNTVVMRGINDDELIQMASLSMDRQLEVRFIELMPMGGRSRLFSSRHMSIEGVKAAIETKYALVELAEDATRGPARYWRIPGAQGKIGFIAPMTQPFCRSCNRIRVTAEGQLRPCLGWETGVSLKNLLKMGDREGIKACLETVAWHKPLGHAWDSERPATQAMLSVGG